MLERMEENWINKKRYEATNKVKWQTMMPEWDHKVTDETKEKEDKWNDGHDQIQTEKTLTLLYTMMDWGWGRRHVIG